MSIFIKISGSFAQEFGVQDSKEFFLFRLKSGLPIPPESIFESVLQLILENSDSFSKQTLGRALHQLYSLCPPSYQYSQLFLLICDFSNILKTSFTLQPDETRNSIVVDPNVFAILELMFYLFIKIVPQTDKQLEYRLKGK